MMKTVSIKEALMMLDTEIEQDMKSYSDEMTLLVIKKINQTPKLYKDVKKCIVEDKYLSVDNVAQTCYDYAEANNNEFGDLFQTELDVVNWDTVIARV